MSEETKQEGGLQVDLQAAIAKHLPSETSGILRERLDTLVKLEGQFEVLTGMHEDVTVERDKLLNDNLQYRTHEKSLLSRNEKAADRETALSLRERACEHREQVIDIKEQHAKERVAEMRDVVRDVFSNNRYKYKETATVPVPIAGTPGTPGDGYGGCQQPSSHGFVSQETSEKTVEGEGTPSDNA